VPYCSVGTLESIVLSEHIQALHDSASGMIVSVFDPPSKMHVSLNPRASDAVRKSAYDYDLKVSVRSSPLDLQRCHLLKCPLIFSGHLLSVSKRLGRTRPGPGRRCSRAGVPRCG
jgi:hypothetical protein